MERNEQIETLAVERISTDGTQARAALSETVITEYAEALVRGEEFPPIEVYFDDHTYWLADGFHRLSATRLARRSTIAAVVRAGGRREALLHAVGANETHGLRRTDVDRRHAVMLLLDDPEWRLWSNREVARQCSVSEHFVRSIRRVEAPKAPTGTPTGSPPPTRKVQRGGKTYTMQTGRIGKVGKARTMVERGQGTTAATPGPKAPAQRVQPVTPPSLTASKSVTEPERSAPEEPQPVVTLAAPEPAKVTTLPVHTEESQEPEQPLSAPEAQIETPMSTDIPVDRPSRLAQAWQAAPYEERQAFVAVYNDELQTLLGMLGHREPEQGAAAVSKTRQRKSPTTKRQKGKSDGRSI
jgi:hypothetical protein